MNFKVKLQEIDEKHFSGNFVAFCHNSKIYRSMQEFDEDIRILSFYYFFSKCTLVPTFIENHLKNRDHEGFVFIINFNLL